MYIEEVHIGSPRIGKRGVLLIDYISISIDIYHIDPELVGIFYSFNTIFTGAKIIVFYFIEYPYQSGLVLLKEFPNHIRFP